MAGVDRVAHVRVEVVIVAPRIKAIGERGVDAATGFDHRAVAVLCHETLAELAV